MVAKEIIIRLINVYVNVRNVDMQRNHVAELTTNNCHSEVVRTMLDKKARTISCVL